MASMIASIVIDVFMHTAARAGDAATDSATARPARQDRKGIAKLLFPLVPYRRKGVQAGRAPGRNDRLFA
jgi:hypothetical protein